MTSAQIVGLGVRLFAIWLVVSVVRHAPGVWHFNVSGAAAGNTSTNVLVIIVAVVILALAAGLWFFPLTVANRLLPKSNRTDHLQVPIDQAQSVGFSLLGLWVLASAIPDSFHWAFMVYRASRPHSMLELGADDYSYMVATAVEVILGIWLLFGASGLRGLLRRARTAGS